MGTLRTTSAESDSNPIRQRFQTVRSDVVVRLFNIFRVSLDNLVLCQQFPHSFRRKSFKRRLSIYFLLTGVINWIIMKVLPIHC